MRNRFETAFLRVLNVSLPVAALGLALAVISGRWAYAIAFLGLVPVLLWEQQLFERLVHGGD